MVAKGATSCLKLSEIALDTIGRRCFEVRLASDLLCVVLVQGGLLVHFRSGDGFRSDCVVERSWLRRYGGRKTAC
jgi:hypothetical protein